eukprot:1355366-Pleurochrysis_carterae.AAC.3
MNPRARRFGGVFPQGELASDDSVFPSDHLSFRRGSLHGELVLTVFKFLPVLPAAQVFLEVEYRVGYNARFFTSLTFSPPPVVSFK